MRTYPKLRDAIRDWMHVGADIFTDARVAEMVDIVARRFLRDNELHFGEDSDTFATVADTQNYAIPAGWSKPFSLWYLHPTGGNKVDLTFVDKAKLDELYPDSTKTGPPEHFTVWGANIQLGKVPDQVITINRNYYRILPPIGFVGSTISFTNADSSINDSDSALPIYKANDSIVVAGSSNNNGTLTVSTSTRSKIVVSESITDETAGSPITLWQDSELLENAWDLLLFDALVEMTRFGLEDKRLPIWRDAATEARSSLIRADARSRSIARKSKSNEPR